MSRPMGQPGTAWYGDPIRRAWDDEVIRTGLSYPAVLDDDGVLRLWRDGQWIASPGFEPYFDPGPEWQAGCPHEHGVPWRTCDSEAACDSLAREELRTWGE